MFATHDVCFVHPTDYPDRYTLAWAQPLDQAHSIIAGSRRWWRTVDSVTVTYAARAGTLRRLRDVLPNPDDDFANSGRVRSRGGQFFSPLPTLGAHLQVNFAEDVENFTTPGRALPPLFFELHKLIDRVKRASVELRFPLL